MQDIHIFLCNIKFFFLCKLKLKIYMENLDQDFYNLKILEEI